MSQGPSVSNGYQHHKVINPGPAAVKLHNELEHETGRIHPCEVIQTLDISFPHSPELLKTFRQPHLKTLQLNPNVIDKAIHPWSTKRPLAIVKVPYSHSLKCCVTEVPEQPILDATCGTAVNPFATSIHMSIRHSRAHSPTFSSLPQRAYESSARKRERVTYWASYEYLSDVVWACLMDPRSHHKIR